MRKETAAAAATSRATGQRVVDPHPRGRRFGPVEHRDPAQIERDLREERLSVEHAQEVIMANTSIAVSEPSISSVAEAYREFPVRAADLHGRCRAGVISRAVRAALEPTSTAACRVRRKRTSTSRWSSVHAVASPNSSRPHADDVTLTKNVSEGLNMGRPASPGRRAITWWLCPEMEHPNNSIAG